MFGTKKQHIKVENVHTLKDALRAIKWYIYIQEWTKTESALKQIIEKEQEAFSELEYKIKDDFHELQKQRKIFEKNKNLISKLEKECEIKKIKYERKIEWERFKVRFNSIKKEIKKLWGLWKNNEALNLLTHFFEDNQQRTEVVTFYSKEKKKILRNIKKGQKKDRKKIQDNAELEAIKLAWLTLKDKRNKKQDLEDKKNEKKQNSFHSRIINKLNFHKWLREKHARKKLIDEVKILIEEEWKAKQEIAEKKLENIHKWLVKELEKTTMLGFDLYWKILGSDKISWDSFGFVETKNKYNFYIWDATGHGVRAWLIVSILSKTFQEQAQKDDIINLTYTVNNTLKENLQSKNFVTGIFFELDKNYKNVFNVSWMGHEPLLIYRSQTKTIERIIAWGLAWGIRLIKQVEDIKPKALELYHNDIVITYSDWVLEAKWETGKIYGLEKLEQIFLSSAQANTDIRAIYNDIIEDLKLYRWGTSFEDDTTMLMFRRNPLKDIMNADSEEIEKIKVKENLSRKDVRRLEWKTKWELEGELLEIKKEKQTQHIIVILKWLYMTWEFLKLKEEATRYIKEWFIHKDINFYLRKAIDNEEKYIISQRNTKMENKYNVLAELMKKKDFNTVIQECNEIIAKDWNV
jgi:serine phosphatase RsbU (regulator of sigma subunit)